MNTLSKQRKKNKLKQARIITNARIVIANEQQHNRE